MAVMMAEMTAVSLVYLLADVREAQKAVKMDKMSVTRLVG